MPRRYRRRYKRPRPYTTERRVKRVLRKLQDTHFKDTCVTDAVPLYSDSAGTNTAQHLSGIAQGNTKADRTGNRVSFGSLQMTLDLIKLNTIEVELFRVLIFRWSGGGVPQIQNVLSKCGNSWLRAFYRTSTDTNFQNKYSIMFDRTFTCSNGTIPQMRIPILKKWNEGSAATYDGVLADTASAGPGNIWLFVISNRQVADATLGTYNLDWRLKWADS